MLSKELNLKLNKALKKEKSTDQQADLSKQERLHNVEKAFSIKQATSRRVILVDDVFTTGATLIECAKVLKEQSKCEYIVGFTLARGY